MDRKGIIAISLAVITLIAWTFYNQREMDKLAQQRALFLQAEKARAEEAALTNPAPTPAAAVPAPVVAAAPVEPPPDERLTRLTTKTVDYTFTNLGGGIAIAGLVTHVGESGRKVAINEFGAIPIGAISEVPGEGTRVAFETRVEEANSAVTFERTDARQLRWTKRFTLSPPDNSDGEYLTQLDLTIANRGAETVAVPGYFVHAGAAAPVHLSDLTTYTGLKSSGGKFVDVNWFSASGIPFFGHPERPVYTEARPGVGWLGVTNQYFSTLLSAQSSATDPAAQARQYGTSLWARHFNVDADAWQKSGRSGADSTTARPAVDAALGMPGFSLEPGKSLSQSFSIYSGPREFSRLKRLGSDEEEMMDFGIFSIVSRTLLNGLNWFHAKLGSYAAAIIVLTLVIKSLLWPLQNRATNSMKKMQGLQPKMLEIREKYSDDPTRMNTETMKLYRDYGVNPVSGCLPMLVQIPIFFGFYNMLGKAVELRNSHFLWVQDLSQPDTVWHLAGIPVNILPLFMAGTMLWQMAISPKSGDPTQQRMMMFMPLIFVFFCYNYASALALYWTVQNLFSVVQLYATRNQAPPQLVKVAAPAKKK